ncbi:MAG TPA: hypothetical protein PK990_03540 [Salinivirgaceae bacterium]|nr:hypothetical protein [Salinivirgaceae bacterium]
MKKMLLLVVLVSLIMLGFSGCKSSEKCPAYSQLLVVEQGK